MKFAWWFYIESSDVNVERCLASVMENADLVDELLPCIYSAKANGDVVAVATADQIEGVREVARKVNARVIPLIAMQSVTALKEMFSSPEVVEVHIGKLIETLKSHGFDIVDIDYECLPDEYRERNTAFFLRLAELAHAHGIEVSFPAQPKEADYGGILGSGAQDYAALGSFLDQIRVMCYDQHHWAYSGPGPVGGADWADSVISYSSSVIPTKKLYMGIPVYGHEWDMDDNTRSRYLPYPDAVAVMGEYGISPEWDATAKVPHFDYVANDGARKSAWYSDRKSFAAALDVAEKHSVSGISVWVLGQEDPGVWDVLREYRRSGRG